MTGRQQFHAHIPGQPVPQGRARIARSGHHVMSPESRAWREGAVLVLRAARQGAPPIDNLCRAAIEVIIPRPARRPDRVRPATWSEGGVAPAGNAADLDNYVKAALDAAQDAGWLTRDHLVAELVARKVYAAVGQQPGLTIQLVTL